MIRSLKESFCMRRIQIHQQSSKNYHFLRLCHSENLKKLLY